MNRILLAALALAFLTACSTPQPMGEGIWKAVKHTQGR